MNATHLTHLRARFCAYVDGFAGPDGLHHPMQELKRVHSHRVASDARQIAVLAGWDPGACDLAEACGLLHDVGRFSQFAEFGTFEDRRSVNHGSRGCEVLSSTTLLDGIDPAIVATLLAVTRTHNALEIPAGMGSAIESFVRMVRDADKLDIWRVIVESLGNGDIERHREIALDVDWTREPRPELCDRVGRGERIPYADIRTLGDFLLVLLGWRQAIHFPQALRLASDRGLFAQLAGHLPATKAVKACFAAMEIEPIELGRTT